MTYLEFDIARELEQLHREVAWQSGQNARTLVKYDGLRIVLIALQARSRIPEHQAQGHISIQTVVGHIQVRAQGRSFELSSLPRCGLTIHRPGDSLSLADQLTRIPPFVVVPAHDLEQISVDDLCHAEIDQGRA